MGVQVVVSALDSARFGVCVGRCTIDQIADVLDAHQQALAIGVELLLVRSPVSALLAVQAALAHGAILADTLLSFVMPIGVVELHNATNSFSVRLATPSDVEAIRQVARVCFRNYGGHYHTDPRLNRDACDALYVDWAERSVLDPRVANLVLLAESSQHEVMGFTTLKETAAGVLEIGLTAVLPEYQGAGVNRRLLQTAQREGRKLSAQTLTISTQISNVGSQKSCISAGFVPLGAQYTLHWWLKR